MFGGAEDVYLNCCGIPWREVFGPEFDVDDDKIDDATILTKYWAGSSKIQMKVFVP